MAPSSIAWLDTSPEVQRRVRELLTLFGQRESRDELGIGQVRDAISNLLFPGMSVLQTRARYYLFVPWCFLDAGKHGARGEELSRRAHDLERTLAVNLSRVPGIGNGVIGSRAGQAVKILPSAMFWTGLRQFGILQRDVSDTHLLGQMPRLAESDELAVRTVGDWHPTLPPPPPGFPWEIPSGFTMTRDEAQWLRERILEGAEGTLLGNLVRDSLPLRPESPAPWLDPAVLEVAGEARSILDHAQRFSLLTAGATRVYSLLVAEAYARSGFGGDDFQVESYRTRVGEWREAVGRQRGLFDSWDLGSFWGLIVRENAGIGQATRAFVEAWLDVALHDQDPTAPESRARVLVARRERALKRGQSRLDNMKLLGQWGGSDLGMRLIEPQGQGSPWLPGALSFRWPNARNIIIDIQEGCRA